MHRFANPARFMRLSAALLPWCGGTAALLLAAGLYLALFVAPPDYQQGEAVRIMFVHVPAAWMASMVYALMALASAVALIWRHPLADIAAQSAAPLGAGFTLLCLVTGSLWGEPMWGTWWVWDARLTSVLVLFFLYLGYIALVNAFDEPTRGARAGAILALVGIVNLPIIKFSVDWWNTLHQPASVFRLGGPTIDASMLWPLLIMALGFTLYFAAVLMIRMRRALMAAKLRALRLAEVERHARKLAPRGSGVVMPDAASFLAMGGYALYVWPAYGAALIVLGGLLAWSIAAHRRVERALEVAQRERG
jgi:heme exporter protein C